MSVLLILAHPALAATQPVGDFHRNVEPILAHYCYDCHGQGEHKGSVTLDDFKTDEALLSNRDFWWKVLKNVRAGIMPPQKNDRPSEEEKQKLAAWIKYGEFWHRSGVAGSRPRDDPPAQPRGVSSHDQRPTWR